MAILYSLTAVMVRPRFMAKCDEDMCQGSMIFRVENVYDKVPPGQVPSLEALPPNAGRAFLIPVSVCLNNVELL